MSPMAGTTDRVNLMPPSVKGRPVTLTTTGVVTIFNGLGGRDCRTILLSWSGDKIQCERPKPEAMGPSQIESSYNFTTMWYQPLQCDTVRFILTSVIIVNLNVFERQEMCMEKIRKWEDTVMSWCVNGWLIHSSLFVIGWFIFSEAPKAEMLIFK